MNIETPEHPIFSAIKMKAAREHVKLAVRSLQHAIGEETRGAEDDDLVAAIAERLDENRREIDRLILAVEEPLLEKCR